MQYRLRTLLILTTLIAVWMAWWSHAAQRQREAVAALSQAGAYIEYDFQHRKLARAPFWPTWLVKLLGVDYLANVVQVDLPSEATDAVVDRRESAAGRLCDAAALIISDRVVGAPAYHPLLKNADERLAELKVFVDRFGSHLRPLDDGEYQASGARSWNTGRLYISALPPLGRPATAGDVTACLAVFELGGHGKLADPRTSGDSGPESTPDSWQSQNPAQFLNCMTGQPIHIPTGRFRRYATPEFRR